jgi:cytochrome P450
MQRKLLPPGPPGKGFGGNAARLKSDLLGFMRNCAHEYPGLCHFRVGPVRVYQVNEPRLVKEVLQDHADKLRKPWDLQQWRMLIGKGLLTNDGEHWRQQRRALTPAFHHDRIRRYAQLMTGYTTAMLDGWQSGERRRLNEDLAGLTLRIICKILFGIDEQADAAAFGHALDVFVERYERLVAGVLVPMAMPTPGNLRAWHAACSARRQVRRHLENRRSYGGDDLLSWLLATQADTGMSDRQIVDEVVTLVGAGHETTANALAWAMTALARHPQAALRLRAELDGVLAGRVPGPDDLPKLVFTRKVLDEAMRLYPPAYALARTVAEPFLLDGYLLPKNARVVIPIFAIHQDPRWYPNPMQFDPDRWTPEFERERPKYAFFPFGGGPRFCIGSNFAAMEAVLLLAAIAQRFEWTLDPDHEIGMQASITLRPRHGVRATVRARAAGAANLDHIHQEKHA